MRRFVLFAAITGVIIFHDQRCADFGSSMRPEQPARVVTTVAHLQGAHPGWKWEIPDIADEATVLLAHSAGHLQRFKRPGDFDADTPNFPEIYDHARRAVGAACAAMTWAWHGNGPAFALMRPPGHHATADQAMGFCYLNQIAVAAIAARRLGVERVAVWDFDAHHGNGTQAILDGKAGYLFASVHQFPGYPGTGTTNTANCFNWPVPPHTPRERHMAALRQSLDVVTVFRPDLILVSAGFDAYIEDPITEMTLAIEDFTILGRWLRETGMPAAAILEGGYSSDLPLLVDAFLRAWHTSE